MSIIAIISVIVVIPHVRFTRCRGRVGFNCSVSAGPGAYRIVRESSRALCCADWSCLSAWPCKKGSIYRRHVLLFRTQVEVPGLEETSFPAVDRSCQGQCLQPTSCGVRQACCSGCSQSHAQPPKQRNIGCGLDAHQHLLAQVSAWEQLRICWN